MFRRIFYLSFIFVLIIFLHYSTYDKGVIAAEEPTEIYIDGEPLSPQENSIYINSNNEIMIPLRWITEKLEVKIEKDGKVVRIYSKDYLESEEEIEDLDDFLSKEEHKKYIAHAGGSINGFSNTNCKEALDFSYEKGRYLMELDFAFTTDGSVVLVHQWDGLLTHLFNVEDSEYPKGVIKPLGLEEFMSLDMVNNFHQMTLQDLIIWMKEHPKAMIITDTKEDNIQLLLGIKDRYPHMIHRFIPQIYSTDEYEVVKQMGYEHIILTLYKTNIPGDKIYEFAKNNKLYAVTMPIKRVRTGLPILLNSIDIYSYCHTINDIKEAEALSAQGIDGFYTDDLFFKEPQGD